MSIFSFGKQLASGGQGNNPQEKALSAVFDGSLPWEARYIRSGLTSKSGEVLKAAGFVPAFGRSVKSAWEQGPGQTIFGLPINVATSAFAVTSAKRGHKLSAGISTLTNGLAALAGNLLGGPVASFAASLLFDAVITKGVARGIQHLSDMDKRRHGLGMGGGYVDTELAYTMRQAAAQEMSGSLFNARQHLGREARMLHN